MDELSFKPGPDITAIQHIEQKARASGIIVEVAPSNKYPARGVVLAIGDNMSMDIKVGDIVLYNMAVEEGIVVDGFTFDLALGQNILGTFPKQAE